MIKQYESIPITYDSHPFAWASKKCNFKERGYLEEEYFIYGTANIYTEKTGELSIAFKDAPYINRIIVRYPNNASRASGRAIIEILNASTTMDIDRIWMMAKEEFIRNGDVYIGISSKPAVLKTLKKFDPKRYESLHWTNPRQDMKMPQDLINNSRFMGELEQGSEAGLIWDMLSDLAKDLKTGTLCFGSINVTKNYLVGWSQSSLLTFRYANTFAKIYNKSGKPPIFDGYLAAGGSYSSSILPGVNQYENPSGAEKGETVFIHCSEPFITVQTESENAGFRGLTGNAELNMVGRLVRQEDSDEQGNLYRVYDIPGSTHDNKYNMIDYYKNDEDLDKVGIFLGYQGREPYPNDYPYELVFNAVMRHLYRWAEKAITPPRVTRILFDSVLRNVRDCYGNAIGGWRLPFVDVPVATYFPDCTPIKPISSFSYLFGCKIPFTARRLKELYGSLSNYQVLVEERSNELVEEGLLLPEDKEICVKLAVKRAAKSGLC